MKQCVFLFILLLIAGKLSAQLNIVDSIKTLIAKSKADTTKVRLLQELAETYRISPDLKRLDSALHYGNQSLKLARIINDKPGEIRSLMVLGRSIRNETSPIKAIEFFQQGLRLSEEIKDTVGIILGLNGHALIHYYKKDFREELSYYWKVESIARKIKNQIELRKAFVNIGNTLLRLNQPDSAEYYILQALKLGAHDADPLPIALMGRIMLYRREYDSALSYFKKALLLYEKKNDKLGISQSYYDFGRVYEEQQKLDSALHNYKISYEQGIQGADSLYVILSLSPILATLHEKMNHLPEALHYFKIASSAIERENNAENLTKLLNLEFNEKERKREAESAKLEYSNKVKLFSSMAGILLISVVCFFLYHNNKHKQKANLLLTQQKQKVENTLIELKSTQSQLIQSEKMASLGELTAGIAHEIQNPLNFVNNFSEVNNELIEELKSQKSKLKIEEQDEILNDIFQNNEKINHHGKRADAIVKGMLQHSRSSNGVKEPTDINALADEYLRLAYHGLRAKDKSFNATIKTDFDQTIGNINIIPQEIGRVILNLITNAFYVVTEKKKENIAGYEPTVSLSSKKVNEKVEIKVADNGNGIPELIKEKIFQPFFTTKPSGQGTGLGLSLAYDIITKAHGGELKVKSKEGEGSEFKIILSNA
jgi:signal transduction histidine kinase